MKELLMKNVTFIANAIVILLLIVIPIYLSRHFGGKASSEYIVVVAIGALYLLATFQNLKLRVKVKDKESVLRNLQSRHDNNQDQTNSTQLAEAKRNFEIVKNDTWVIENLNIFARLVILFLGIWFFFTNTLWEEKHSNRARIILEEKLEKEILDLDSLRRNHEALVEKFKTSQKELDSLNMVQNQVLDSVNIEISILKSTVNEISVSIPR